MTYLDDPVPSVRRPEEARPDRQADACRAEALDLRAMADELATAAPKLGDGLNGWRQRVDDLLAESMVDDLATPG